MLRRRFVALIHDQEAFGLVELCGKLCGSIQDSDVDRSRAEAQTAGNDVDLVEVNIKVACCLFPPLL